MAFRTDFGSAVPNTERGILLPKTKDRFPVASFLMDTTQDDAAESATRHCEINWNMDGAPAHRTVDTTGTNFDQDLYIYPGYSGPDCKKTDPNQPYSATFAFRQTISTTATEFWDRWSRPETAPPYGTSFISKFRTREIMLKQGMYMAAGQRCDGPVVQTSADFVVVTSLRIRRRKDVRCIFFFQSRGTLWNEQDGRLGTLMLQVFNGTNKQLAYTQEISDWLSSQDVSYKIVLTDVIDDIVRDDSDDFNLQLTHTCHDATERLGTTQGSGAVIQFALANETSREPA